MRFFVRLSVLLSVFLILSCTPPTSPWTPDTFAPPAWIIGSWKDISAVMTWTFTADNIVYSVGATTIDYKAVNAASTGPEDSYYDEIPDASTYELSISSGGTTVTYQFVQTSVTTLDFTLGAVIELIKQ